MRCSTDALEAVEAPDAMDARWKSLVEQSPQAPQSANLDWGDPELVPYRTARREPITLSTCNRPLFEPAPGIRSYGRACAARHVMRRARASIQRTVPTSPCR